MLQRYTTQTLFVNLFFSVNKSLVVFIIVSVVKQLKLFRTLVIPSPLSFGLSLVVSAIYIIYISWAYLNDNFLIFNYFLGPSGVTMRFWKGTSSLVEWFTKFFSSDVGYYLSLLTIALVVGAATYTLLQLLSLMFRGTAHFVENAERSNKPQTFIELFVRLWVRCLVLVGWVFFIAVTLSTILPYVHICMSSGASYLQSFDPRGILPYVQALFICVITLHIHVVFVRMVLLRPRIFDNSIVELSE